jgi:hypothetical protein
VLGAVGCPRDVADVEVPDTAPRVAERYGVHVEVRVHGDRATEVVDRLPVLWEFCAAPVGATGEVAAEVVFDSDPQAWAKADADGAVSRPDLEDLLRGVPDARLTVGWRADISATQHQGEHPELEDDALLLELHTRTSTLSPSGDMPLTAHDIESLPDPAEEY